MILPGTPGAPGSLSRFTRAGRAALVGREAAAIGGAGARGARGRSRQEWTSKAFSLSAAKPRSKTKPTYWRALIAVLLLTSCQEAQSAKGPLPPGPPVVVVTMDEYSFDYDQQVPSGRVVFRFVNDGDVAHQPDVVPLPDDLPPIDEQLRGDARAVVFPLAGVPTRDPGETGTFAVDLAPGARYAIICFARNRDGASHALLGMSSEFRAEGG